MSPSTNDAEEIGAVLFDLDGTLLDTLQDLADAANAALQRLGYPAHPVRAYRHFVGDGMRVLARRVLPAGMADGDRVEACLAAIRRQYGQCWAATSRPYDGIAEMLDTLTRRRMPLAILSNKPHDFTLLTVDRLLDRWHFAAVRGVDGQTLPKPDPAGAIAIAAAVDVAPEHVLFVGDTATDMETAAAAGMVSVGVTWGFREEAELRAHGARHIIDAPAALLDLT